MGIPSAAKLASMFEKTEATIMALTFKHLCDIYQQSSISPLSNTGEMSDAILRPFPVYAAVLCWYEPTAIFDQSEPQGLQEEVNIMTSDHWNLPSSITVNAGNLIVMRTIGHPLFGRAWEVQGNSTTNDYAPIQIPQRIWVMGKLVPTSTIPLSASVNSVSTATATALVH